MTDEMTDINVDTQMPNEVDSKKLKRMILRIYKLERDNSKTENKVAKKMRDEIQKIIEEEARKCY